MVKIGMTRRLNPMDRITELGDASVPFRYSIHALFFSQDAVGIETALHLRREFFYATRPKPLQRVDKIDPFARQAKRLKTPLSHVRAGRKRWLPEPPANISDRFLADEPDKTSQTLSPPGRVSLLAD